MSRDRDPGAMERGLWTCRAGLEDGRKTKIYSDNRPIEGSTRLFDNTLVTVEATENQ